MKAKWNNQYVKMGITLFVVIIGSILFYYLLFHGSNIMSVLDLIYNIMMPVFFGVIMAYLLTPTLNFIENRMLTPLTIMVKIDKRKGVRKLIRGLGILLTAVFFYFLIQGIIRMLLSQIIPSIESIISNSDVYYKNITNWLNQLFYDNPELLTYLYGLFEGYFEDMNTFINDVVLVKTTEVIKTISLSVISIIKVLWNFVLGFIISIYLLISKEKFANQGKKIVYALAEREKANLFLNNVRYTHNTFIGFIGGKIIDSLIIGVLCFIGTSILKTPYAALVSVIIGITNVIPFFGPFLGAIPTAILVLVVDPLNPLNCVYFVLFILFLQQLDGNLIGPMILGDSTGLSSFWVIFAITVFGGIFGIAGMIIGVPTFAVIYAVLRAAIYVKLKKKNLPTQTEAFDDLEYIDDNNQILSRAVGRRKKHRKDKKKDNNREYRSGDQYISCTDEWDIMIKNEIDRNSQIKIGEECDEICDSESEACTSGCGGEDNRQD